MSNYHSDSIKVNFVSATLSPKVEALGSKLMKDYSKVGFGEEANTLNEEDYVGSIPKQVKQYFMEMPTQYRLVYLLMFLYAN